MKNCDDFQNRINYSPSFSKTAREWILASALYDGIEDEDIRQIQTLLSEKGADPNVLLPEYGITPFHLVVANESIGFAVQATDICLQHGADPNVRSEDGLTPVHLSAMWGCKEVLHVLLASGGNPWLVDCFNKNAFDYAESEGQQDCYNILKTYCNTQPKPSSYSKSPYQLNLKRVILYKNDLQIVYEASPSSSRICASTQTSPTGMNLDLVEGVFTGKSKSATVKDKNRSDVAGNKHEMCNSAETNYIKKQNVTSKNIDDSSTQDCNIISRRMREMIVKHRRDSTIFEYSPSREVQDSANGGCNSWKDMSDSGDPSASVASELIERLEYSNKIRQSIKSIENQNDLFKNITERKKQLDQVKPPVTFVEKAVSCNEPYNDLVSPSKIGFVLNDSIGNSTIISNQTDVEHNEKSPPSIGFILDNLDESLSQTRSSSLFSDIASDIDIYTTPGHNVNIFTEDENSSREEQFTKNSSTDSLYAYVTCDSTNTREEESGECFETCFDKLQSTTDTPSVTGLHSKTDGNETNSSQLSETENINLLMDSILNNIGDEKLTPVNPELITSTPERISGESETPSCASVIDLKDESGKQKWVEAELTSSDDEQYMSISEEYEYRDMNEGVVLIEKHYLLNDTNISATTNKRQGSGRLNSGSETSEVSTLSGSDRAYDTDDLRRALREYGVMPGPINGNTKRVYLRKLKRCRRKPVPPPQTEQPAYSPELLKTLNASCDHLLYDWSHLEDSMSASFACARRPWREGQAKTSFTYLMLDPRLAHNLPACASSTPQLQLWKDFLRAIFYVGKGKRSRPYSHLYKAVSVWHQENNGPNSRKIQRILDIWKAGQGVVCLHVFVSIIPVEAFTREAAMISALTLQQLTNEKSGEFYGSAACWSLRLKRRLGCVLLHRAFKVFLAEGERQLRPADID